MTLLLFLSRSIGTEFLFGRNLCISPYYMSHMLCSLKVGYTVRISASEREKDMLYVEMLH